jgi:hypothetical protein
LARAKSCRSAARETAAIAVRFLPLVRFMPELRLAAILLAAESRSDAIWSAEKCDGVAHEEFATA